MSEIREQCVGRWQDILHNFGVPDHFLNGKNQACPFCQAGKDRFRWTNHLSNGGFICSQCGHGDGFELLMRWTHQDFADVAKEVRDVIGETTARPAQNSDVAKNRARLKKIWSESQPLSRNCPTHLYLCNRGLSELTFSTLQNLRCHPGIDYWYSENGERPEKLGTFPAMVGAITTVDNLPATLHITYLTKDGHKAALDPVRKIMSPSRPWNGGAVRLNTLEAGQVLCVAEGIETALSMKLLYPDLCPWAVISAGNMEKFEPPNDDSPAIYVAADNDVSYTGQAAAYALAKKLIVKKFDARVLVPTKQGTDFNDELNQQAIAS